MIDTVLFLESTFMVALLTSNNILMNDCKKNKTALKTLVYVNFVGAAVFLGFFVFVLTQLLSSGALFYSAGISTIGASSSNPGGLGPSATSYVMFTITRMASMFAVALMVLNGIDNMACNDEKEWEWLQTVNWIFVAMYGIFFAYSGYKLFRP